MVINLCSADMDLAIGPDSSAGSTLEVKSPRTETRFVRRERARSLREGSPMMPRRRAELIERWTEAHERVAKGVMFCKPRNASTVLARLSMHVFRKVFERSREAVLGLIAGRHSSDVMYDIWR